MSVHFIFMNGLLDSFRFVVFVNRVILREVVHGCPLELHLIFHSYQVFNKSFSSFANQSLRFIVYRAMGNRIIWFVGS